MKMRDWPRLGLTEVMGFDLDEDIRQTIDALLRDPQPDPQWAEQWRTRAANHLRRVLNCPKAMRALGAKRGAKRRLVAADVALAYVARREQLGRECRGSATTALKDVSESWSRSPETVKSDYTAHGAAAEGRLQMLLERFEDKVRTRVKQPDGSTKDFFWSRDELLAAIQADLLEQRKRRRTAKQPTRRTIETPAALWKDLPVTEFVDAQLAAHADELEAGEALHFVIQPELERVGKAVRAQRSARKGRGK